VHRFVSALRAIFESLSLKSQRSPNSWLRVCVLTAALCVGHQSAYCQSNNSEWTWLAGNSTLQCATGDGCSGYPATFGPLGSFTAGSNPGSTFGGLTWMDGSGDIWLFGGNTNYIYQGIYNSNFWYVSNNLWEYNPSLNAWAWMGGSQVPSNCTGVEGCEASGVYGTLGQSAASNMPGGRAFASGWTDPSGNLWIFGGAGAASQGTWGELNDLWKYSPSSGQWTWMGGSSVATVDGQPLYGVYGTEGVSSPNNMPGGRSYAAGAVDANGNFWVFGGFGEASIDASLPAGELGDLWEFNPSTLEWAWISGSTSASGPGSYGDFQMPAAGNAPPGRYGASGWVDPEGNFWVFGGFGYPVNSEGFLNDLWKFNPSTCEWAWMAGNSIIPVVGSSSASPGVYGTMGIPASGNSPGSRTSASSWTDSNGKLWLFGGDGWGAGGTGGDLDDLWEFNPDLNEWAWMAGSNIANQPGDYSSSEPSSDVTIANLDISSHGTESNPVADGTTNSNAIHPGGRASMVAWTDQAGNFWVFGGNGIDGEGNQGYLNDLWVHPALLQNVPAPTFSLQSNNYLVVPPISISDAVPSAAIYYTIDGSTPTNASMLYNGPIIISASPQTISVIAIAAGYNPSPIVRETFGSTASQTLTFPTITGTQYDLTTINLIATASSGLPVSFTSSTPSVCSISGSTASLLTSGQCGIVAWQSGGANYAAAATVSQSFTVHQATQTITFPAIPSQLLGAQLTLTATASSGLPVTLASTTPSVCTFSGATATMIAAGNCTIKATQAGSNVYYAATAVSRSFTVTLPTQTIAFPAITGTQTALTAVSLSATASSGLPVSFASTTPTICTVSATAASLLTSGLCRITASQSGSGNFAAAPSVSQSFEVHQTAQTITFAAIPSEPLGSQLALTATANSGLPVSFNSATPSVCTVSGATATIIAGGSCTIQATQAGDSVYYAATTVSRSFTVTLTPQTITFPAITATEVALNTLPLSATASSGLPVSFASLTPTICTVSGANASLLTSGLCRITASQPGNSDYAAASPVSLSFEVHQASQTISFGAIPSQQPGAVLTLTATASSGLTVSFDSTTSAVCTVSGTTATMIAGGNCAIQAKQAGNTTYLAAPTISLTFAVTLPAQTITFPAITGTQVALTSITLSATASSGLSVSFASTTPTICTVSGTTASLLTSGLCRITGTQPGSSNYAAAPSVSQSFEVHQASQTISFPAITGQTAGTSLSLAATASSGLPVSFASTSTAICTISGTTVSFVEAGNCTIQTSQTGNSTYLAAPKVSQTVAVTQ
jgi:N-acetylneuraminic acid mutarotase